MPRKSKAKKIHQDKIRQSQPVVMELTTPKITTVERPNTPDPHETLVAVVTKKDLIKTIIIIGTIFALEFAIFYATLN